MKPLIKLKTTTLLVIPLVLACFALLPSAQAATPELLPAPAPDGAYTGFNTAEGLNALFNVNTAVGQFNTAVGFAALKLDTTGAHNTGVGAQALLNNNTGGYNTAIGENALVHNTTGGMNMALGQGALANNKTGSSNTAMGFQALNSNTASQNVAVGFQALISNTTGGTPSGAFLSVFQAGPNTAVGSLALGSNVDAGSNTAVGYFALGSTTSGFLESPNTTKGGYSTAVGFEALASAVGSATGGVLNDAFGSQALANLTTGYQNVGIGGLALFSNITGHGNTAVGFAAGDGITGNHNICIGDEVEGGAGDNIIRIGSNLPATAGISRCFIGGIFNQTINVATGTGVFVDSAGKLGTIVSSRRYKNDIKPMDRASEAILALKPVTFRYKQELDPDGVRQFGLVAEDVEKVNPDLVVRDAEGKVNSVRYEAVNAMLLNEFLKEHRTVQELKSSAAKQEAIIAQQQKQIEALTAGLQKVSAQIEVSKPAPQTVLNNQ
jgi:trimeric autotransporter adhesin